MQEPTWISACPVAVYELQTREPRNDNHASRKSTVRSPSEKIRQIERGYSAAVCPLPPLADSVYLAFDRPSPRVRALDVASQRSLVLIAFHFLHVAELRRVPAGEVLTLDSLSVAPDRF